MIGVDLDEVLCPTLSQHCKFLNEKYSLKLKEDDFFSYEFYEIYIVSQQQAINDFLKFTQTPLFNNLRPFPYAREFCFELKKLDDLCLITSRQNSLVNATNNFINTYFLGIFSKIAFGNLYSFNGERKGKLQLCHENNCSLLIEDDPKHVIQVAKEIPVIMPRKPWNKKIKETKMIKIAENLEEAVEIARKIHFNI